MKILAIETATAWQSVAILDDTTVLACHDETAPGAHAKTLLPTIDRLFSNTGLSLHCLDGLVVSIGPGSFTGLRIGLATALGFRTATRLPLAAVPTLEGLAWNLRGSSLPICPVLNSRKGELYWAIFRWVNDNQVERIVPETVGPPSRLGHMLTEPIICFGEGWALESPSVRATMPRGIVVQETTSQLARPSAVSIGLAGLAKLHRGEVAGTGVAPLYVQRSEAELKFDESGGLSPVARRQAKITRKLGLRLATADGLRRRSHK
jgi:tRNA threonylcarbamoyladenosine biosynthesis protein TsaB